MTHPQIIQALAIIQCAAGLGIIIGGLALLAHGVDRSTRMLVRWPLVGLVGWGAWLGLAPFERHPDSPPAIALSLLVAYVLLRYGRQVRGILSGEDWWPPTARRLRLNYVFVGARRQIPMGRKLNPVWALFGNEDDGPYGDAAFNPERRADVRAALRWWLRNPCHNLCFYVLGVADRPHVVIGKHAPSIDAPGLITHTVVCGRLSLPFIAYNGRHVVAYIGWRPNGAFGPKLRRARKEDLK